MKVKLIGMLTQGHSGDAGYDMQASERVLIAAGCRATVRTGVKLQMPENVCAKVLPRSGLAREFGVVAVTGLIDPGYRGEVGVTLLNLSGEASYIKPGMRIAQLLFVPFLTPKFEHVDALDESNRGENGFGSTGL